jgi:hypothetical protein
MRRSRTAFACAVAGALGILVLPASAGVAQASTPATASSTVTVAPNSAAFALSAPSPVTFGRNVTVSGTLSLTAGAPAPGTAVTVTRTVKGSTATKTWSLTTGTGGAFALTDPAPAIGSYTYTATYAGNATTAPATSAIAVTVARTAPSLAITAGAADYAYGSWVRATATLGPTFADRTISVYAQPSGGAKKLVTTATVNAQGGLTFVYQLFRTTAFSAVFGGDAHNAPVTATLDLGAFADVWMSNSGYYTSTTVSGTVYRVYHHTGEVSSTVVVTPGKPGECVKLEVQWLSASGWLRDELFPCETLSSASKLSADLTLLGAAGFWYRMRADYVPSSKDNTNVATDGSWFYFKVVS